MHVSTYDSNPAEWDHVEWPTPLPVGPEAALAYLCSDNDDQVDEGDPLGPISYAARQVNGQDCFIMVAAWCSGHQWFKLLCVFSATKLPESDLEALLAEQLPEDALDEEEDEDE